MPPHSEPVAHLQRTVSPSGSLTARGMVWLQPSCRRMTGAVMARGVELILPVSFRRVRFSLVNRLQLPPIPPIQQQPVNPTVTSSAVTIDE